jgi:hypothetical protein
VLARSSADDVAGVDGTTVGSSRRRFDANSDRRLCGSDRWHAVPDALLRSCWRNSSGYQARDRANPNSRWTLTGLTAMLTDHLREIRPPWV